MAQRLDRSGPGARALVAALVVASGAASAAHAQWNPVTGIKTGAGADVETAMLYTGPRLMVYGGMLDFLGSATINGPVLIQQQNGWGHPIVNVAGTFNMSGPSFQALDGAKFFVNGAAPGAVNAGFVQVAGGSEVVIGSLNSSGDVRVENLGTSLHVLGDFGQTGGDFLVLDRSGFLADGAFNLAGNAFWVRDGSTLGVGNPAIGSVHANLVEVDGGSQATIGELAVGSLLRVAHSGSSLHAMGDFSQTGGNFLVTEQAAFQADGSFDYSGNAFWVRNGSTFSVGAPAAGSVQASLAEIDGGSQVTVGAMSVGDVLRVGQSGSSLHVMGDYSQTGGNFLVTEQAAFHADGSFDFSGNTFWVRNGSTFSVGDPAAGLVQANLAEIDGGSQVTIGALTIGGLLRVAQSGSALRILGDCEQTAGNLAITEHALLQVDGDLHYSTKGAPNLFVSSNSVLRVGQTLRLSAGNAVDLDGTGNIGAGANAAAGTLRIGDGGVLAGRGTIVANVLNDGGEVRPGGSAGEMFINGTYTQTGAGTYQFQASGNGALDADRLTITGAAALAGALNISLLDGFAPLWGSEWTILSYAGLSGDFESFAAPTLGQGLYWWRVAGATSYTLGVRLHADTNHDGVVDFSDLNNVLSAWNTSGVGVFGLPFATGDTNEDGVVGFADLNNVLSFFNSSAPTFVAPAPGGAVIVALALGGLSGRRSRRSADRGEAA